MTMVGNLTHIIMTNQSMLFHKSKAHSYVLTLIILLIHHLRPSRCTLLFSWYTWKSVCALPSFPSHCNLFHPKDQEHTNLYWGLSKGFLLPLYPPLPLWPLDPVKWIYHSSLIGDPLDDIIIWLSTIWINAVCSQWLLFLIRVLESLNCHPYFSDSFTLRFKSSWW